MEGGISALIDAFYELFNVVDAVAIFVVCLSVVHGLRRGLSGELAAVVSVVAALLLGLQFFEPLGSWVEVHTRLAGQAARAMAFVITVLASIVALILTRYALKRIMRVAIEPEADKIGGAVAGLVRACAAVVILFLVMNLWPHKYLNRKFGEESLIGRVMLRCVPELRAEQGEDEADRQKP